MPCGYKLSPAAQGNLDCSIILEIPYFSLPCVRGEKALSCLSGFPQKSRSEFCGKRSGRHIRSCGKRSAPQTKAPCRDEVGLWPLSSLGMPHCSGHFRAPAQMRSRCVGRGAARSLPREKVSCRRQVGGVVDPDDVTEEVTASPQAPPTST